MSELVVSLCDLTGNVLRPWAEAGYECIAYDIQHPLRSDRVETVGLGTIRYRNADIRSMTPADWPGRPVFKIATPPCTHTAVSGARDFRRKGMRKLIDALELAESSRVLLEWDGEPGFLENPVATLSTYWRPPDYRFDPSDYGDPYTKKTCIWAFGKFVMPPKTPVEATLGSMMHRMPPGPDRANQRSAMPMGFARAVFLANARARRAGAA